MTDVPDKTADPLDPVLEEALDWLHRMQAAPGDDRVRAELAAWLERSTANADAYGRVEKVWRLAGDLPPTHETYWAGRKPAVPASVISSTFSTGLAKPLPRSRPSRPRARVAIVSGAIAAALLLVALPSLRLSLSADYATGTGESRQVSLSDGTVVTLNAKSAIAVDYSPEHRTVVLLSGEALFAVVPDTHRAFSVNAEGVMVTVVGTVFDVNLTSEAVGVAVQRGMVQVDYDKGARPINARLGPGDRLKVSRAFGTGEQDTVSAGQIGAWRNRQLVVERTTIAQVSEILQRYYRGVILVQDDALAANKVTGVYDLDDPVGALKAAVDPHAGVVHQITPYLLIVTRR